MKVCLFIGTMSLGGIGKLMLNLMEEFVKRGVVVDVFLMKSDGEYIDQIPSNVRVFIVEGTYFKRILGFINYLRKEKPDVSISARQRQDLVNILSCLCTLGQTKPVVSIHTNVTVENSFIKKSRNNSWWINALSKILYRKVEKYIAVSAGVAEDFSKRTGIDRSKIKVIYNPVYKPYSEDPKSTLVPLSKLAGSNKRFIIGAGRLTVQKDFETLVKAFYLVKQNIEDVMLIILGEGPLRNSLKRLISDLGLHQDVLLLGYVSNPQYYISQADLFVLSSKWEGFGVVIVEAMGVGTPIVSTDCPSGPREILEGGKYGKLVPVGNPKEMASAIKKVLDMPHQKEILIKRACDFATDRIADEYLNYILN